MPGQIAAIVSVFRRGWNPASFFSPGLERKRRRGGEREFCIDVAWQAGLRKAGFQLPSNRGSRLNFSKIPSWNFKAFWLAARRGVSANRRKFSSVSFRLFSVSPKRKLDASGGKMEMGAGFSLFFFFFLNAADHFEWYRSAI